MKKKAHLNDVLINLISTGKFLEAEQLLLNSSQEYQKKEVYWYHRGFIARKLGKLIEAEEFCKKSLSIYPDNSDIKFELGLVYQEQKKYEKAIIILLDVITQAKENEDDFLTNVLNSLALTYKKKTDYKNALKYYNLALDKLAQVVYISLQNPFIDKCTIDNQITTEGWMRLAVNTAIKNASSDKIKNVLWPDEKTLQELYKKQDNRLFYDEGNRRFFLPSYLDSFYCTLKKDILYSIIVNNIGTVFAEIGEYDKAKECYQEAIEFTPNGIVYNAPIISLKNLAN